MPITLHPSFAIHPGTWLKSEIVDPANVTVIEAARAMGVTRQALSALLNARAGLSAEMAIRFEKAFGLRADTLLGMQAAHDLVAARAHEDTIVVERSLAAQGGDVTLTTPVEDTPARARPSAAQDRAITSPPG